MDFIVQILAIDPEERVMPVKHPIRRKGKSGDVAYSQAFHGRQRRPNGTMPVNIHQQCGYLLQQLLIATDGRRGAHELVSDIRCTLDSWVMMEYDCSALDSETLNGLYFPGQAVPRLEATNAARVSALEAISAALVQHYPDGMALKRVLCLIGRAIDSVNKWDGKPRGKVYRETFSGAAVTPQSRV